jgi:hypothetical protein
MTRMTLVALEKPNSPKLVSCPLRDRTVGNMTPQVLNINSVELICEEILPKYWV